MRPQRKIYERDFEAVHTDLENVIALLRKNTVDATLRQRLLRELRLLLDEADELLAADQEAAS